jgi:branched-chain amino acid transport system ATP-binding protein
MREQIGALRKEGLSVLLAEQSLDFVLALSDRLYILEKGEVKFTGTPADVRANERELQKYLTV